MSIHSNSDSWLWLEPIAAPFYDNGDPSHDLAHVRRVVATCAAFGRELEADLDVLMPAAYLHDVVNVPKSAPDRADASRKSAEKARGILGGRLSEEKLALVMRAIEEHSFSRGLAPSSLESAILQDADRLDAVGAIGVLRTATVGARMGASYCQPHRPFDPARVMDDRAYTVDHFDVKLLKLAGMMNTAPGRREAERRTKFMREFLVQLRSEIDEAL